MWGDLLEGQHPSSLVGAFLAPLWDLVGHPSVCFKYEESFREGVHNRRRGNLPCLVQEVVLYLRQEISALLVLAVVTEVTERVEMRKVNGFVALFAQFGLFPCAIRPLADAALDLKTSTNRQHPEQGRVDSNLTTMSTRAITSNGMGAKYS